MFLPLSNLTKTSPSNERLSGLLCRSQSPVFSERCLLASTQSKGMIPPPTPLKSESSCENLVIAAKLCGCVFMFLFYICNLLLNLWYCVSFGLFFILFLLQVFKIVTNFLLFFLLLTHFLKLFCFSLFCSQEWQQATTW